MSGPVITIDVFRAQLQRIKEWADEKIKEYKADRFPAMAAVLDSDAQLELAAILRGVYKLDGVVPSDAEIGGLPLAPQDTLSTGFRFGMISSKVALALIPLEAYRGKDAEAQITEDMVRGSYSNASWTAFFTKKMLDTQSTFGLIQKQFPGGAGLSQQEA